MLRKIVSHELRFLPNYEMICSGGCFSFNSVSVILSNIIVSNPNLFATDACLTGCGAICMGEFFYSKFPDSILQQRLHIFQLELLCHRPRRRKDMASQASRTRIGNHGGQCRGTMKQLSTLLTVNVQRTLSCRTASDRESSDYV